MEKLTSAAYIVVVLSANEAYNLKSEFLENEHILLGLLKVEELIELDKSLVSEMEPAEWEEAVQETASFKEMLKSFRINCKNIRRRLRKILVNGMEEEREFSGHRSEQCRQLFKLAGEKAGDECIALSHLMSAILATGTTTIDRLFGEFLIDRDLMKIQASKEIMEAGESGAYRG